jgi:predicted unusual protein kinase regulating ubiquinone biosynthesis (AarF/ABC1/UbiB family)
MEYVHGEKLDAWLERTPDPAERHRVAMLLFEVFARMFHELHLLHADPHPGNYLLGPDGDLVLLDYGCVRDFRPEFTDGSLRLIQDLRHGRRAALPERFRALGFHNVERFDAARLDELARLILAPYLAEGAFPMGRWDIQAQLQRYLQRHLSLVHFQPPGEAIFFFRTCAGLLGHMRRLDACGDFAGTISEIMRRRGIEP